jgi:hypothetical protein
MQIPNEIKKIINNDSYQVFLLTCPANLPFIFAKHSWFVINKKGVLSRWEVLFEKNMCELSWQHLHKDFLKPFDGIGYFPYFYKLLQKSRMEYFIEGDINSDAKKISDFIENSPKIYPFCDNYQLTGPNSNTYVQWVLDNNPQLKISLPKNSLGKEYSKK